MEDLSSLRDSIQNLLSIELDGLVQLEGETLITFNKTFGIQESEPVFFGNVNLVVTSPTHFNVLRLVQGIEIVLKIEIPEYNQFLYVLRFFNNEFLSMLLKMPDTEIQLLPTEGNSP